MEQKGWKPFVETFLAVYCSSTSEIKKIAMVKQQNTYASKDAVRLKQISG